jgi:hypothetical protein
MSGTTRPDHPHGGRGSAPPPFTPEKGEQMSRKHRQMRAAVEVVTWQFSGRAPSMAAVYRLLTTAEGKPVHPMTGSQAIERAARAGWLKFEPIRPGRWEIAVTPAGREEIGFY